MIQYKDGRLHIPGISFPIPEGFYFYTDVAVSYTHLDVYKRQEHTSDLFYPVNDIHMEAQ